MYKIRLLLLCILCYSLMNAQNNIHFTQYYNAPMTLNPALTGQFNDAFRATAIMRQQWSGLSTLSSSEYLMKTASGSFETSLLKRRLGIGLCILNDETGSSIFNSYRGYFSLSYAQRIGDNYLSIGVQPMFNLSSLDRTKLDFGKIDESNFNDNVSYFDLNAGINYHHDFGFFLADFGASATHLLQPKEQFSKVPTKERIPMFYKAYATFKDWEIVNKLELHPGIFVGFQANTTNIVYGSNISYKLFEVKGQASKIYLGLWGRSNRTNVESIIGLFGIGFGKTTFMASYDYNTTFATREQYVTGRTNTFEFSIVHTFTPKVKPPLLEDNFIFNPRF